MPRTIGDVVSEARTYIQDTVAPYRYTNADLVTYFNDALVETKRLRPDFYIGTYGSAVTVYTDQNLGTTFPLNEQAITPCAYYVAGSASLRDDEHEVDARTTALLQAFVIKLTRPG